MPCDWKSSRADILVAESGYLVAEIRAVKRQEDNIFYLLDAGLQ